ncbi:NAD(P)/FAD-dependent oxidoreductase [Halosolutus gelatinilyticus]|uniref:NAD(P)/FAD-dependent oxidoreductase n=1 Tax=Halosolutus gelatinilyticus TaxID=2931975 RepID=UPI001FF5B157|nr:NAD(P)/FAD-dependent oxidoreductase [Halosolutus gelatinilyticus]
MVEDDFDGGRPDPDYDVIVVGGGPAGLSAALQLGRSLRSVLLCDSDEPRNGPASRAHGYLTRDGISPTKFRRLAREEVTAYESVDYRAAAVSSATDDSDRFRSTLETGETYSSRKLVLATGVTDVLPDIDGFERFWGSSVHRCPYCHGYELRGRPLGVHVDSAEKIEIAKLVYNLSDDLVVFTDGSDAFDDETRDAFVGQGVQFEDEPIAALDGSEGVLERVALEDGREINRRALYYFPGVTQHTALVEQFGLSLDSRNLVETDANGRTSIDGLFVAGDASDRYGWSLSLAAAEGSEIGAVINAELSAEPFASDE